MNKFVKKNIRISIIVCVKNGMPFLKEAIQSILKQKYPNLELIVCYDSSIDDTEKFLLRIKKKINILFKQKIPGNRYTALNESIKKANGKIIGILHADDFFFSNNVLKIVNNNFVNNKIDILYSDIVYVSKSKKRIIRYWKSSEFIKKKIYFGWCPPHTSIFLKKIVFNKVGYYNEKYSISSDYDFILRLTKNNRFKFKYLQKILIAMRIGGDSNKFSNLLKKSYQDIKILIENNIKYSLLVLFLKIFRKVPQFFIK
jgi:glycosyltransferase